MSSMIVELLNNVSSRDKMIKGLTYHMTLLPEPAKEREDYQSLRKSSARDN